MSTLKFTKMHGCGNDYIYFDCFENPVDAPEALSKRLSDRHFSVGGDGIVLICPSDKADCEMRMFNADGSEGKMCGNAIRCVAKYMYERRGLKKTDMTVETLSGVKSLRLELSDGTVSSVTVNMGRAVFSPRDIPVASDADSIIGFPVNLSGTEYKITCVSMGNPHCVVFGDDPDNIEIEKTGPIFENNGLFPERVNTEFVQVLDRTTLKMRVWERGSGETMACGTGACAVVSAAVKCGICDPGTPVTVKLRGGELIIKYTEDGVYMTGKAEFVFEGMIKE